MRIINEAMLKMNRIINDMNAIDMSTDLTIIMEDMEVEVDSLGIATIDYVGQSNVLHAIKKAIDMQNGHTRT